MRAGVAASAGPVGKIVPGADAVPAAATAGASRLATTTAATPARGPGFVAYRLPIDGEGGNGMRRIYDRDVARTSFDYRAVSDARARRNLNQPTSAPESGTSAPNSAPAGSSNALATQTPAMPAPKTNSGSG